MRIPPFDIGFWILSAGCWTVLVLVSNEVSKVRFPPDNEPFRFRVVQLSPVFRSDGEVDDEDSYASADKVWAYYPDKTEFGMVYKDDPRLVPGGDTFRIDCVQRRFTHDGTVYYVVGTCCDRLEGFLIDFMIFMVSVMLQSVYLYIQRRRLQSNISVLQTSKTRVVKPRAGALG